MRQCSVCTFLVLIAFLFFAGPAQALGIQIRSGQSVLGEVSEKGRPQVFRFDGIADDVVSLKIKADKKTSLDMDVKLLGHDGGEINLGGVLRGKMSAKTVLAGTGTYYIVVWGKNGSTGRFKLSLKVKQAKYAKVVIPVPGIYAFTAPQNSLLSISFKAADAGLEPGVDSVITPWGNDLYIATSLTEKGSTASIKGAKLWFFGMYDVNLAARSGGPGNVTVKLKLKPIKEKGITQVLKKLGLGDLVETSAERVKGPGGEVFRVVVRGGNAELANAVFGPLGGPVHYLDEIEPNVFLLEGDTALWDDGLWSVRYRLPDYPDLLAARCSVTGDFPKAVVFTSLGSGVTPTLEWTGGDLAQVLILEVFDQGSGEILYETLLPAALRTFTIPAGVIPDHTPYEIVMGALSATNHRVVTRTK